MMETQEKIKITHVKLYKNKSEYISFDKAEMEIEMIKDMSNGTVLFFYKIVVDDKSFDIQLSDCFDRITFWIEQEFELKPGNFFCKEEQKNTIVTLKALTPKQPQKIKKEE